MTITVAFINICEHNRFANDNWIEKKNSLPSLSDNKEIICNEQLLDCMIKGELILFYNI